MLARLVVSLTLFVALFATNTANASFGDPVTAYGTKGHAAIRLGVTSKATAAITQSPSRVVVAGTVGDDDLPEGFAARLTDNGRLDRSFGVGGIVKFAGAHSVRLATSADGMIFALTRRTNDATSKVFAISRDGQRIPWFGDNGEFDLGQSFPGFSADDVAVQGQSLIVVGTKPTENYAVDEAVLTRLSLTGKVDASFGEAGAVSGANEIAYGGPSLAVLGDGSIVTTIRGVVRYDANGTVIPSFRPTGQLSGGLWSHLKLAATPSGGFAAIGTRWSWNKGTTIWHTLGRYDANGQLVSGTELPVEGGVPVVLPDDSVVAVGSLLFESPLDGAPSTASLLRPGATAAVTIEQTFHEQSIALDAAALTSGEIALVGQSCDGICNAVVTRLRLTNSKTKKLSPGLWKPHKQINNRPVTRISGRASQGKGLRSVSVAIHAASTQPRRASPCRWLSKDRVRFVTRKMTPTGPCGKPIFIRATGGKRWHLDLPRKLPGGIYEIFVRGHWSGGRYNDLTHERGSYLFFSTN